MISDTAHFCTTHHRAKNKRFSTLKRTKTGDTQPKLNVVCFAVQSCPPDADFVTSSNYCLIGTLRKPSCFSGELGEGQGDFEEVAVHGQVEGAVLELGEAPGDGEA